MRAATIGNGAPWAAGTDRHVHRERTVMSDTIRVLIVEREPLFRRGLTGCLAASTALDLIGSGASAEEGYKLADESAPDVALVGTTLPDAPGLAAATEMRRRYPALATIVVAANETDDEL